MDFGSLFRSISGVVDNHTRQNDGVDTDGLIGQVANLFRQHGASDRDLEQDQQGGGNILPASQDPYGDPADQGGSNILPASQDPYGDPADQTR